MKDIFYTIFKYKDKKSPDKLGLYPERVHTKAFPERRYLWSSRMLVIIATISIAINMILASTLILLLPQKTSYPRLVHLNKNYYNLEQTQPAEKNIYATELLAEADITEYIKLRYQVTQDRKRDLNRWAEFSRFYWLSSGMTYLQFIETEARYANAQRDKGLRRNVIVEWVKPITFGVWHAQFKTYDYYPNKPMIVNTWRATVRIKYAKLKYRNKQDMVKNPYGFVIEGFYLSYVGKEK